MQLPLSIAQLHHSIIYIGLTNTDSFSQGHSVGPAHLQKKKKKIALSIKKETKELIDQDDQLKINNLNPHHSQSSIIAAEI